MSFLLLHSDDDGDGGDCTNNIHTYSIFWHLSIHILDVHIDHRMM